MINLTDEELYQKLTESGGVNELIIDSDIIKDETYGDIVLHMYICVDIMKKRCSVIMDNIMHRIPYCSIFDHGQYVMFINRDTLESEFFDAKLMMFKGKEDARIDRKYPKYWEETGFVDKFLQVEKVLKRIASEIKDTPWAL